MRGKSGAAGLQQRSNRVSSSSRSRLAFLGLRSNAPLPPYPLPQVDRTGESDWQERLAAVGDPAARAFIARCLAPVEQRPAAADLLDDPFLQVWGWGWPGGDDRLFEHPRSVQAGTQAAGTSPRRACWRLALSHHPCAPHPGHSQPPKKQAPASSVDQELIKSKSDAVLQNSLVRRAASLAQPGNVAWAACAAASC